MYPYLLIQIPLTILKEYFGRNPEILSKAMIAGLMILASRRTKITHHILMNFYIDPAPI
jgi:hypothetical protein